MKHKKLKVFLAIIAVLFVVSVFGNSGDSGNSDTSGTPLPTLSAAEPTPSLEPIPTPLETALATNPLMDTEFQMADVFNGFETEKIGEYGYIEMQKSDMAAITGGQLVEFCKSRVDGSGLNWVWIMFEDGTGLHINPGSWFVSIEYGTVNTETTTFSDKVGAVMPETWSEDGSTPTSFEYVSFEELYEIQSIVENLVESQYDGFCSCTVDFMGDASGYSVSLLIDDVAGIEPLELLIYGLEDTRISEVSITAMKDGKLLGTN